MAHNVETMAYAGETPWHGLGKKTSPDLTPEQFMVEAQLDWEVAKRPLTYRWKNPATGKEEHKKSSGVALVRLSDGKELDQVSGDWEPVQNAQAFEFFYEYVMAGDMEMHTAGSLQGGRIVWALAKTKESFTICNRDQTDAFVLFTNFHIYGKSTDVRFTPIRVVCNNTLDLALNQVAKRGLRMNHRRAFDANKVKEAMGIYREKFEEHRLLCDFLASRKAKKDKVKEYASQLFPLSEAAKEKKEEELSRNAKLCLELIEKQPGAQFGAGTWWPVFNAVTFMTDHVMGHKADSRLNAAWYGANRQLKIDALHLAKEMADA